MPGLFAETIMKNLMKNKPKNEHYVPRDYPAARENAKKLCTMQPLPRKVRREETQYGYWYDVEGADRNKVLFYIHGGGFNTGSAKYSYNMVRNHCREKDHAVFSVEYRLAPEHPYPAGLEDCVSAYQYLLEESVEPKNIVFAGDSAGGNLVFALALYLKDHNIPLPAGLCGISPVGTLDDSLPSRKERVDMDCIIGADFTEEMKVTYVRDHNVKDPYLSPIYGDFAGLPPIWICVGTDEVFYDDAFILRDKAREKGIPVELIVGEGMCHVYPDFPDPQSTKTIKSMKAFIAKCMNL